MSQSRRFKCTSIYPSVTRWTPIRLLGKHSWKSKNRRAASAAVWCSYHSQRLTTRIGRRGVCDPRAAPAAQDWKLRWESKLSKRGLGVAAPGVHVFLFSVQVQHAACFTIECAEKGSQVAKERRGERVCPRSGIEVGGMAHPCRPAFSLQMPLPPILGCPTVPWPAVQHRD